MHPTVSDHVLQRQELSIAVHEAGHYIIGQKMGLPVKQPVIAPDRMSGYVAIDVEPRPKGYDRVGFISSLPRDVAIALTVRQGAMYLAGFAAEARLCRCVWAPHYVIGEGSSDLDSALKLLKDADLEHLLFETWQLSRESVDASWHEIFAFAKTL